MAYLGSTPTTQSFIAGTDSFNGTGSATNFTLTRSVSSVNDVQVVVNNVVQYPPNYSVSGTTLTISPAPSAGTNNVYVRYLSTTLQSIAPSQGIGIQFGIGSLALPSISFIGDTNTGIYSPAADTLAFVEGGTEAMRINSSANVGIGTSSPASTLTVKAQSGMGAPLRLESTDASANPQTIFAGSRTFQIGTGNASSGFAGQLFFYDGTAAAARMLIDSSGNLQFNSGYGSVATAYGCRAWVNFNGTGTVAIRASGNVSSITDNGTGDYTVNFTTAMPDANYSVSGSTGTGESSRVFSRYGSTQTTSTVRVVCVFPGTALFDDSQMHVAIFR